MIHPKVTINCRGKLLDLTRPVVMGVLNINTDSFYSGSRYTDRAKVVAAAGQMLLEGAGILDIGGMSSRPGAQLIGEEEELQRVIPAIEAIHRAYPAAIISVDTIRSKVAREAVQAGASIVNDISAGRIDPELYPTVADLQVPYVLMHMQRRPENMQEDPTYEDVVREILDFFIAEVDQLHRLGVKDILVDPGFGFGKTVAHNYEILRSLHVFRMLDAPILAGLSRKSMICKPLGITAKKALNGTTALHMIALQQGARVLRVHDVAPAMEVIRLWELVTAADSPQGDEDK